MVDNSMEREGERSLVAISSELAKINDQSTPLFSNKLPPELRRSLSVLLFVGKVAPYSGRKTNASLPYTPHLQVCKAMKCETEPVLYENTFILYDARAIDKFFDRTLSSPARKLLLNSVKLSFQRYEHRSEDKETLAGVFYEIFAFIMSSGSRGKVHDHGKTQLIKFWLRKVAPLLDKLTLNRLVLDLSDSFCPSTCSCSMAAMAVMCFKKGFALQAPKTVKFNGWTAGRDDVAAVVQDCLGAWTMGRAKSIAGDSNADIHGSSKAVQWLLEEARKEERMLSMEGVNGLRNGH